jgi:hypothetical protein
MPITQPLIVAVIVENGPYQRQIEVIGNVKGFALRRGMAASSTRIVRKSSTIAAEWAFVEVGRS